MIMDLPKIARLAEFHAQAVLDARDKLPGSEQVDRRDRAHIELFGRVGGFVGQFSSADLVALLAVVDAASAQLTVRADEVQIGDTLESNKSVVYTNPAGPDRTNIGCGDAWHQLTVPNDWPMRITRPEQTHEVTIMLTSSDLEGFRDVGKGTYETRGAGYRAFVAACQAILESETS